MQSGNSAKAFAPGNISCVFKVHTDPDPRWMGSMGLGFTINEGVIVEVSKAEKTQIYCNNEAIDFPTVGAVIDLLTKDPVAVHISTKLPLGAGFGLSGASGLATAYALNNLLHLTKTNQEFAILVHTAEVTNKTGLGDVTNQYLGGMLAKFKPSSHFVAEKLNLINCKVYCKYISKLSTASILTNPHVLQTINQAGDEALKKLHKLTNPTLGDILSLSKSFALDSGLLQDPTVRQTIATIEQSGGHASMIMLGNAVMSDIPFEGATEYEISDVSAHLL